MSADINNKIFARADVEKEMRPVFRLFRHFQVTSPAALKQQQQEICGHGQTEAEKLKIQNKHFNFLSLMRDEFKRREGA
ncbi:MAG: hypothetical protein ACYSXD_04305 [Planctomycetota bacterium]